MKRSCSRKTPIPRWSKFTFHWLRQVPVVRLRSSVAGRAAGAEGAGPRIWGAGCLRTRAGAATCDRAWATTSPWCAGCPAVADARSTPAPVAVACFAASPASLWPASANEPLPDTAGSAHPEAINKNHEKKITWWLREFVATDLSRTRPWMKNVWKKNREKINRWLRYHRGQNYDF